MAMGYCTPSRYKLTGERRTYLELARDAEEEREVQAWVAAENERLTRRAERQRQREYCRKVGMMRRAEGEREVQAWVAAENERLTRRAERQRQREYYRKVGMMRRALGKIDDVIADAMPVEVRVDKHDSPLLLSALEARLEM